MSQVPSEARKGADWMPDESSKSCVRCKKEFGMTRWKYHCYCDGRLLCADCTPSKCVIPADIGGTSNNEVRVCSDCKEWCEQVDQRGSGKYILRGTLLKAYENYVLGLGSLSPTQIDRLKTVTTLPDLFISGYKDARFKKVTSIDISMFIAVREIGSGFLYGYSSLQSIDLKPLSKVTSVSSYFLYGCSSLRSIDLKGLSNVTSVSSDFLSYCSSLQSIDLKGLSNVTSLDSCFLYGCSKLTKKEYLDQVDLTPLLNIPDSKIEMREYEDKENNLKTALQRVRFQVAVRNFFLVCYKSQCRIGKVLLSKEWLPRKLLSRMLIPVRSEE